MTIYSITYEFKNKFGYLERRQNAITEATSLKFAKNKLLRKHCVKSIKVLDASVVGYC